jgi:hypothetical protein
MNTALRDYSVLATLTFLLFLAARAFPEQAAQVKAHLLPTPAPVAAFDPCRPCPKMRPPTFPLLRQLEV